MKQVYIKNKPSNKNLRKWGETGSKAQCSLEGNWLVCLRWGV